MHVKLVSVPKVRDKSVHIFGAIRRLCRKIVFMVVTKNEIEKIGEKGYICFSLFDFFVWVRLWRSSPT